MHVADPEPIPHADQKSHDQTDEDGCSCPPALAEHRCCEATDQADDRTDGQVDVTACQDAEQHTTGHHQNVTVLKHQV